MFVSKSVSGGDRVRRYRSSCSTRFSCTAYMNVRLAASVCDATEILKEPECHCVCGEVAAREAEASDSVPDYRRLLRRVISDAVVLHERNFAAVVDIAEPLPVRDRLILRTIGLEGSGGQRVGDADLVSQDLERGAHPLQRNASAAHRGGHHCFRETDEGSSKLSAPSLK